ncbi:beta-ketoacyl synthase chain length factor [Marinivivus vitaminiproducens]|uniref:beta-ketoacyl synthase chain length factor n=1 Tax=Marinivivus vitaminiproducens TaxID=3035935 RepID=UPI00279969D5|nr:beta-ketoacyl synthase chain length factor [Geminicoccaceae bacterium SCSIO 64248]
MTRAYIAGVAIWGPGLEGWEASRPILAGYQAYVLRDSPPPPPAFLSSNERRRAGIVTRLALKVANDATAQAGLPPASLRSVFGSSNGDAIIVNDIIDAVTTGARPVSPTQFHNSVHNAAAGYWSIATRSHQPATCVGGHDFTFAAALLKAVAEATVEDEPALLCVYDVPCPDPLGRKRTTQGVFGVGLVLTPDRTATASARIDIAYAQGAPSPRQVDPLQAALVPLSRSNPAAQALRLLELLAGGRDGGCALPYLESRLDLTVTSC